MISNDHRQVAWAREESPAFMPVECQSTTGFYNRHRSSDGVRFSL
ncbi:MAG TPA: hypothetical protein VGN34_21740 [Ktedonobacteraceae bacterium]